MLALSPTATAAHKQHTEFHRRIAAAAARHDENIRIQRMSAKAAMVSQAALAQALREIPVETKPDAAGDTPEMLGMICIKKIQIAVAAHYGVTRIDMISARRNADIMCPRQVAMYLAKTLTGRSFPEIGRRFGGRDHTTVLHAVRKIEARIAADAVLAARVDGLKAALA